MFKKVLIPIDFSQDIKKFDAALEKINPEKIILLNVIDQIEVSLFNEVISAMTSMPPTEAQKELNFKDTPLYKKVNEKLNRCKLELMKKGFEVIDYLKEGVPFKVILEVAEKEEVDLIVIPAVGKRLSVLKEMIMLGGTVTRVVRHSKKPVLIIK